MNKAVQQTTEVELTGWAYGGEALGREPAGRMIFVPFCIPGESVRGPLIEQHARWARMLPQELLVRSPERIEARCPHFTECGGCHYQHLNYDQQLAIKSAIVTEQLQRIGGFKDPPVAATLPSPRPWDYRNHMRYHVLADGSMGFMRYKDSRPLSIRTCSLPELELKDLWTRIEIPKGSPVEQVSLRVGTCDDPMVILHGDMGRIPDIEINLPASIVWQDGDDWRVVAGGSASTFEIKGCRFRVSPPSFFQVNTSILPDLVEHTLSALELEPGMNFFDLYSGVGLFSCFASSRGAHVFAVEQSPSACADFEENLRESNDVSLYEAPVEMALPAIRQAADVVFVDPPRSGLSRAALDSILEHHPRRLVYLSCDPGTFARDAKRMRTGGYHLERVLPIDIFPQTFHIETLSTWRRHERTSRTHL